MQEHEREKLAFYAGPEDRKQTQRNFHWTPDIKCPLKVTISSKLLKK
jgi:hypothetical protein